MMLRALLVTLCLLTLCGTVPGFAVSLNDAPPEIYTAEEWKALQFFKDFGLRELTYQRYLGLFSAPGPFAPTGTETPEDYNSEAFDRYLIYLYDNPPGIRLNVPLKFQIPDMRYGCELTSMAMLMHYATGIDCSKYDIWEEYRHLFPKDYDPYTPGKLPRNTFFPCHLEPIFADFGVEAVNLCGRTFEDVLRFMIFSGRPVILWSADNYDNPWGHVFVLTGYDPARDRVYYNDPKYGIRYRGLESLRELTYYMCERDYKECKKLGSEIDPSHIESIDEYLYAISYA